MKVLLLCGALAVAASGADENRRPIDRKGAEMHQDQARGSPVLYRTVRVPAEFLIRGKDGPFGGDLRIGDLTGNGRADFLVYRAVDNFCDGGGMKPCFMGAFTIDGEALWKAAELYKQSATISSEQRVLESIVAKYPDPLSESIEARFRLLEIAEANGDDELRLVRLRDLVAADATAGAQRSDRSRFLAAKASLELTEPLRERFVVFKLNQPLADSMKLKRALMEEVIDAYTSAVDYGVAEVTTAATYRLAEVYEQLSTDLMDSERPRDLDAEALEQYELLLEEQTFPFEEKAIDLYRANTDRTIDGVYDEWVRRSFDRLAALMPARYAKAERSEDVVTSLY